MRAAIVTGPRQVTVRNVTLPQPGPAQVRIRLEGCGVCASNVTPWQGTEWMSYPTTPGGLGHEGWGVIDAIGRDVTSVAVGDRVAALFMNSYAECDVGDADAVVKLPPSLDGRAFPGEPLGCAMNILRRSEIEAGHTVAIIGIGFLGALLTQLAAHAGAHVIAVSRRQFSLDLARAMGAAETVAMQDHGTIVGRVGEITKGVMCDRVIEATGKQWPLDLAGELIREGGRLVIAGYHQDGPRQVNMQQWNWKGIDVINAHERDPRMYLKGISEAIEAMDTGILAPDLLYTHCYPLSRLGEALDVTGNHTDGFVKALVEMP
jgi:threonine dehydrogenase-like Zn-dependent dehydrogenase